MCPYIRLSVNEYRDFGAIMPSSKFTAVIFDNNQIEGVLFWAYYENAQCIREDHNAWKASR